MQKYSIGKTDAIALRNWRIELDRQHMNKAMDIAGLGLSVAAASVSPPAIAIRLGISAIGIDLIQKDSTGVAIGAGATLYHQSPVAATIDIGYGVWQVIK